MSHRYHPNPDTDDPTEALLWDDCKRCDQQAADPRGLDRMKLAKAWRLMLDVEINQVNPRVPAYKTKNERKLSGVLYMMYVLIERMPSVRLDRMERRWADTDKDYVVFSALVPREATDG